MEASVAAARKAIKQQQVAKCVHIGLHWLYAKCRKVKDKGTRQLISHSQNIPENTELRAAGCVEKILNLATFGFTPVGR